MTAEEFFNTQTITDANRSVIDINKSKFTYWDLIKFAEYYGKHQYNQALDDAVKYIAPEWIYPSEYEVLVRNSKDSILKLKK